MPKKLALRSYFEHQPQMKVLIIGMDEVATGNFQSKKWFLMPSHILEQLLHIIFVLLAVNYI